MRARDLAVPYPSLPVDTPAAEVARLLAEEEVDAVFVERHGQLHGVVSDIGLLVRLLPSYDLGGNATAIGASANVVILGLSERAGHRIGFLQFTECGALIALVTLAISMAYLWLRYFAFA